MPDIIFPGLVSPEQFAGFQPDQRMKAVMIAGDSREAKYYEFLKWCVEHDPEMDVRLAALKRLSGFSGQDDLPVFLAQRDDAADKSALEPYLSMALSRVGLITDEELDARLNRN